MEYFEELMNVENERERRLGDVEIVNQEVQGIREDGRRVCWEKSAEDGATGQEEKRKTKEEVHGCGDGGHASGWCDKRKTQRTAQNGDG